VRSEVRQNFPAANTIAILIGENHQQPLGLNHRDIYGIQLIYREYGTGNVYTGPL
jgi:hypothetical protein